MNDGRIYIIPSAIRSQHDAEIKMKNKFRSGLILFILVIRKKQSIITFRWPHLQCISIHVRVILKFSNS